jgi:glycosyltransferase involved in cell wall biosynthesis
LVPNSKPQQFADCWKIPNYPLTPQDLRERNPSTGKDPTFLFFPMTDWHARLQRTQHIATSLADMGHLCYLLNPNLGREFPSTYLRDSASRFGVLGERLVELHVRLRSEPVFHSRMLSTGERRKLTKSLGESLGEVDKLRHGNILQIVSLPVWGGTALDLRKRFGWPVIYDCHDLLEGFAGIGRDVVEAEAALFEAADLTVFSSRVLMETYTQRMPSLAGRSALIRNATTGFGQSGFGNIGQLMPTRTAKVIGYFGALDFWLDCEALRRCAEAHPEWTIRLIGRVEHQPILELKKLPNIEFVGEVPYSRLPEYLKDFDVALIPFQVTPLTVAANPIKLYEYFSSGVPVVSTKLPEVEDYKDLVYIAGDPVTFVKQVENALAESDTGLRARRVAVAQNETWQSRAEALLAAASSLLCGRAPGPETNGDRK